MCRYSHFDDTSNDCVLFRNEDYLPPSKEKDIIGMDSLEEIETMINTRCLRCNKVRVCTYVQMYGVFHRHHRAL